MVTRKLGVAVITVLFALVFIGMGNQRSTSAEQRGAGDLLLDAALGAGEGAIIGKASGGKA